MNANAHEGYVHLEDVLHLMHTKRRGEVCTCHLEEDTKVGNYIVNSCN